MHKSRKGVRTRRDASRPAKANKPAVTGTQRSVGGVAALGSLAALTLAWGGSAAQAGIITGQSAHMGPGLGDVINVVVVTPTPNNDNFSGPFGSTNRVTVEQKRFDNVGFIDLRFNVQNSGGGTTAGMTEYFFDEFITNNTNAPWVGFQFALGTGTLGNFVPSSNTDFLDFDVGGVGSEDATLHKDPTPTSTPFLTLNHGANTLGWSNGVLLPGQTGRFTFSVDVPDNITAFTVRETPIIPEPATAGLMVLSGVSLLATRRRTS